MAGANMRTTIDIPDPLYREVKARAALQGRTVKEIILSGVKKEMEAETPPRKRTRIQLPLIRGKGKRKIDFTDVGLDKILFG
jgi:hypothetical protein